MKYIQHLHEPIRLWLTWQCPENMSPRTRRIVAEVISSGTDVMLKYLPETEDYKRALEQGFKGYPAFKVDTVTHTSGVMEALARRLPPRKRDDFSDFLKQFRLSPDYDGSDFALLGYTGGKLPSDSFAFVPDFRSTECPLDLLLEVAGFRHQSNANQIHPVVGATIHFEIEPSNPVDTNAVQVMMGDTRLGYVNRALLPWFADCLLSGRSISAEIERINGKPERPLVYVYCLIE